MRAQSSGPSWTTGSAAGEDVNNVDVACVQHEYGIFGGRAGGHVSRLLRELRMPIVNTLHTILGERSLQQLDSGRNLSRAEIAEAIVRSA